MEEEEKVETCRCTDENQSKTIGKLGLALSKAQAEIEGAKKDKENPFFKSSYADLYSVWQACREPLTKNELSIVQTTDNENGKIVIITTMIHSSGEWIRGKLGITPMKNDPQAVGSAITYGRRYALAGMVGVSPEDDDGEGAMERDKKGSDKKKANNKERGEESNPKLSFTETIAKLKTQMKLETYNKIVNQYGEDISQISDRKDQENLYLALVEEIEKEKSKLNAEVREYFEIMKGLKSDLGEEVYHESLRGIGMKNASSKNAARNATTRSQAIDVLTQIREIRGEKKDESKQDDKESGKKSNSKLDTATTAIEGKEMPDETINMEMAPGECPNNGDIMTMDYCDNTCLSRKGCPVWE